MMMHAASESDSSKSDITQIIHTSACSVLTIFSNGVTK